MAKTTICRECGQELRPEQIQAHLSMHWGLTVPDPKRCKEAHSRYMHLKNFADDADVEVQHRKISL